MTSELVDPAPAAATGGELRCPLCDYDLRATTENRCPECGYQFEWDELRDPAKRLHAYLFEHHPERNVSSFVQTLIGGLRPARFWRTLFPTQPSRPRRLIAYWFLAVLSCLAILIFQGARSMVRADDDARQSATVFLTAFPTYPEHYKAEILERYKSPQAYVDATWPRFPNYKFRRDVLREASFSIVALNAILWIAWPGVTLAGLLIFQISMRRARIRTIHVLRCVIYSGDVALWWVLLAAGILIVDLTRFGFSGPARGASGAILWINGASALAMLVVTWRLGSAYRHYLRFRHALMTAVLVQVMVALLAIKLAFDWDYLFR